jgi:hypothetical protein
MSAEEERAGLQATPASAQDGVPHPLRLSMSANRPEDLYFGYLEGKLLTAMIIAAANIEVYLG